MNLPSFRRSQQPSGESSLIRYLRQTFTMDTRSLAVFRVALGLVILFSLLERIPSFAQLILEDGILPQAAMMESVQGQVYWTLYQLSTSDAWAWTLLFATMVCAGLFASGMGWRVAGIALWILLHSLHVRNPWLQNSGDRLLLFLLLWGLFLPLGKHLRLWGKRNTTGENQPESVVGAATVALVLQFVFLYSFGALHKAGDEWRVDYLAITQALEQECMTTALGDWLRGFPSLCQLLTFIVFWTELLLPLLLFVSWKNHWWRLLAVGFTFALHLGLWSTMVLGWFPWISCVLALPLIPSQFWDFLSARGLHWLPSKVIPVRQSVLSWPGQWSCGAILTFVILSNLQTLPEPNFTKISTLGDTLPETWQPGWQRLSEATDSIGQAFGLHQTWTMFSPRPYQEDGWIILRATLANGRQVDLWPILQGKLEAVPVPTTRRPEPITGYPSARWRKYFENAIWKTDPVRLLRPLSAHVTRQWNAARPAEEHAVRLEVVFRYREHTLGTPRDQDSEKVLCEWPKPPKTHPSGTLSANS